MSQQKPLKIIRAERLQSGKLGRSFYALHTHTDAYTVAKLHHQVYERVVESTAAQPLYKASVNFHDVDRGVLEGAEGGITRSEIVHGHTQPQAAHLCQKSRKPFQIRREIAFCQFHDDMLRAHALFAQRLGQIFH